MSTILVLLGLCLLAAGTAAVLRRDKKKRPPRLRRELRLLRLLRRLPFLPRRRADETGGRAFGQGGMRTDRHPCPQGSGACVHPGLISVRPA